MARLSRASRSRPCDWLAVPAVPPGNWSANKRYRALALRRMTALPTYGWCPDQRQRLHPHSCDKQEELLVHGQVVFLDSLRRLSIACPQQHSLPRTNVNHWSGAACVLRQYHPRNYAVTGYQLISREWAPTSAALAFRPTADWHTKVPAMRAMRSEKTLVPLAWSEKAAADLGSAPVAGRR